MKNLTFANLKIGQKAVFSYDRNYMTDQRTRNHDGEVVTIKSNSWEAQGHTYITVENEHNAIYPVMVQELSVIKETVFNLPESTPELDGLRNWKNEAQINFINRPK